MDKSDISEGCGSYGGVAGQSFDDGLWRCVIPGGKLVVVDAQAGKDGEVQKKNSNNGRQRAHQRAENTIQRLEAPRLRPQVEVLELGKSSRQADSGASRLPEIMKVGSMTPLEARTSFVNVATAMDTKREHPTSMCGRSEMGQSI